jgi:hypothetical protein
MYSPHRQAYSPHLMRRFGDVLRTTKGCGAALSARLGGEWLPRSRSRLREQSGTAAYWGLRNL